VADPLERLDERVLEEDELAVGAALARSKTSCSARADELLGSPSRSQPSWAISPPARIRPRRVAFSRTISA
jgi:hypothetical protein